MRQEISSSVRTVSQMRSSSICPSKESEVMELPESVSAPRYQEATLQSGESATVTESSRTPSM